MVYCRSRKRLCKANNEHEHCTTNSVYSLHLTMYNVHDVHCTTYIVRRTSGVYCRVFRRWLWFTILYINNQWPQTINAYTYIRTLPALTIILHPTYVHFKRLHLYQNTPPPTPSHKPSPLFYPLHMYTLNVYTYIRTLPRLHTHANPYHYSTPYICIPKTPTPTSDRTRLQPYTNPHNYSTQPCVYLKHLHLYQITTRLHPTPHYYFTSSSNRTP